MIWDFDGTLAERDGMWSGALVETAALHGVHTTREAIRPFLQSGFPWHVPETIRETGENPDEWWRRLEPIFQQAFAHGAGVPSQEAMILARRVRDVYLDGTRWQLFDDVLPCLTALSSQGWEHFILSNHVPELSSLIVGLGIDTHFRAVFCSALTGVEKPNPKAYTAIWNSVDHNAELWMVGDSWQADVWGAEQAGIKGILVRKQHSQAERFCHGLMDLPPILGSS